MSRRHFIKQAGLMTAAIPFNQIINKFPGLTGEEKVIRIGIIGCGDRGKGLIQVLKSLPDLFKITAICDVLEFRIKATAAQLPTSCKSYKDHHQLLNDKEVDAIVVAVPLFEHYRIAIDALNAGKHLYLEKTMTYDIPQALSLVALSKKHPRQIIQIGHQYRYTPLYYRVKEMIEAGYLGKVTQIDCRWDRNGNWRRPVPEPSMERIINWRMYKEYSGGLIAELLSHQIDFINWAFNTHPDEIMASGGIDYYKDGRETDDNVQAILRYNKAGMIGNFGATCGNAHDGYLFKLKGTKGTISLLTTEGIYYPEKTALKELQTVDGVTGATKIEWNKDGGIPILKEPTKDGTWYAFKDFHKCLTENKQPDSNIITGAKTAICVHLANKALNENRIMSWKPEYNV